MLKPTLLAAALAATLAIGGAQAGVVLYRVPLYSALIAWSVLGERIEVFHAVGAALLLPGIWLGRRR